MGIFQNLFEGFQKVIITTYLVVVFFSIGSIDKCPYFIPRPVLNANSVIAFFGVWSRKIKC